MTEVRTWDERAVQTKCLRMGSQMIHRHVSCWNCGIEHCLGTYSTFYLCRCGCEERFAYPSSDPQPEFDIEFAAVHASPA